MISNNKNKFTEREFLFAVFGIVFGILLMQGDISVSQLNGKINELIDQIAGVMTTLGTIVAYIISRGMAKTEKRDQTLQSNQEENPAVKDNDLISKLDELEYKLDKLISTINYEQKRENSK